MNEIVNTFPERFRADIAKASEILKKYGCSEIYIFGSLVNGKFNEKSDIDIAVKGLKPEIYYKVSSEIMINTENEIDLIDLDDTENRFAQFILEKGELIKVA